MATLIETDFNMPISTDHLFNPSYWMERAQQARNQSTSLADQARFRAILDRHAEDYDRLALLALKLQQQREAMARIAPKFRDPQVIPLPAARPPRPPRTGTDGD